MILIITPSLIIFYVNFPSFYIQVNVYLIVLFTVLEKHDFRLKSNVLKQNINNPQVLIFA